MADMNALDEILDRLSAVRTERRGLEQEHLEVGRELKAITQEQAEIEAELSAEVTKHLDTRAEAERAVIRPATNVVSVHLDEGKQVAEVVAKAGGGDDYRA